MDVLVGHACLGLVRAFSVRLWSVDVPSEYPICTDSAFTTFVKRKMICVLYISLSPSLSLSLSLSVCVFVCLFVCASTRTHTELVDAIRCVKGDQKDWLCFLWARVHPHTHD